MTKKRVAVELDDDVVDGLDVLEEADRADIPMFVNEALRDTLRARRRARALDVWVHGLDDEDSPYAAEARTEAKRFFDEFGTTIEVVTIPGEADHCP